MVFSGVPGTEDGWQEPILGAGGPREGSASTQESELEPVGPEQTHPSGVGRRVSQRLLNAPLPFLIYLIVS